MVLRLVFLLFGNGLFDSFRLSGFVLLAVCCIVVFVDFEVHNRGVISCLLEIWVFLFLK